ncbi:MAG: translation initiation factor IF-2 [Candidatus Brevundimonas phytovorans]|nr:translation initiation factor IF-2 [Brevundimonas sp.]WEK57817.1 MAG: translation initiation factor IF-2 [Brevundimonas sp.]
MSLRLVLAAAATLAFAAPAFAQDAAPSGPAAAAPAMSPEETAFEARGMAFEAETRQMGVELQAVMEDAALDAATKKSRTNAIIDRYAPQFEAFAGELESFLRATAARPERAAQKEEILAAAEAAPAQLRNAPAQIRASIDQALAAPATPAAPN